MSSDLQKALLKLDRPPAVQNWVRLVRDTKPKTVKAILDFVIDGPKTTYQVGNLAVRDRFLLGIDRSTAVTMTQNYGPPGSRKANQEYVEAFFEHDLVRSFPIRVAIEFERQWFKISREVAVPVSPLVVIREAGKLVPIFSCGWSSIELTIAQRQLLMTVWEDAFLSLTDFQESPAEFLFFPKEDLGKRKKGPRQSEVWQRDKYTLLTPSELGEQVEMYSEARLEARAILLAAKATEEGRRREERAAGSDDAAQGEDDLFKPRE